MKIQINKLFCSITPNFQNNQLRESYRALRLDLYFKFEIDLLDYFNFKCNKDQEPFYSFSA